MSNTSSEKSEMSELTWASGVMHEHIAPKGSAPYVETRIRNVAKRLGWKFSRARSIWYADARASIKPREVRRIEEITGITYGHREVRDIDSIIATADALLDGPEADFYRPFVTALRALAGAFDRSGTAGH